MLVVEQCFVSSLSLSADSMIHLQEPVHQASDSETLSRSSSAEFSAAAAPGENRSSDFLVLSLTLHFHLRNSFFFIIYSKLLTSQ
jgi:hypothetical protein